MSPFWQLSTLGYSLFSSKITELLSLHHHPNQNSVDFYCFWGLLNQLIRLSGTQGDLPDQGDVHPHLGAIHTFSVKVSKLDTFIIKCTTGGMDMQTIFKDFLFKNTNRTNLGLNYQIRHTLFSYFIVKLFELTFFCPFSLRIICLISSLFSLSIFYLKNFNNFDTRLLTYRQFLLDFYHQLTKT